MNLRYGVNTPKARVGHETDTCTACAGTMIMEFGALSRLTGNPIYEVTVKTCLGSFLLNSQFTVSLWRL